MNLENAPVFPGLTSASFVEEAAETKTFGARQKMRD